MHMRDYVSSMACENNSWPSWNFGDGPTGLISAGHGLAKRLEHTLSAEQIDEL